MKLRIAILAACAGMLLLSPVIAREGEPISGVDVKLGKNGRSLSKSKGTEPAPAKFLKMMPPTKSGRFKIPENESPRPQNR